MAAHTVVTLKKLSVLCRLGTVQGFRDGTVSQEDTLILAEVFTNPRKHSVASDTDIAKVAPSRDAAIAKILSEGSFDLTTAEKRDLTEARRRQVVQFLYTTYVNPTTNVPYPVGMIETAMKMGKVHVDYTVPVEKIVEKHFRVINDQLPMKEVATSGTAMRAAIVQDAQKGRKGGRRAGAGAGSETGRRRRGAHRG